MHKLQQWYKREHVLTKKRGFHLNIFGLISLLLIFLFMPLSLFSQEKSVIDSQPEILFQFEKLKKNQENISLQVDFNKAILYLESNEYEKAIELFKKTGRILKIPSFLNIGIAYYKLDSIHNAKVYLNKIYELEEAAFSNTYSYMSAAYYLYEINNDRRYLEKIITVGRKHKKLSEHAKRVMADTYIILKQYTAAIKVLNSMDYAMDLKKALLYIKIKNYIQAEIYLNKVKESTVNKKRQDEIIWFMIYRDLKANELGKLEEHLDLLRERKISFNTNFKLPLVIYFNKNKYRPKDYLEFITKFNQDRIIDSIFYFAPFVFSDNDEIIYDSSKGFIFKSKQNLSSLEDMVEYNAKFIELIKLDPIVRVTKLKKLITKDTKSYVYYNLAVCYAQIDDFHNAYKYFRKAYKINPGNKLFSVMTLISAKRINIRVSEKEYIESNIVSSRGLYNYFGQTLYKLVINPTATVNVEANYFTKSIFYKALNYLDNNKKGMVKPSEPLFVDNFKDPYVYLMKKVLRKKEESDYLYYSRLQDTIPLDLNNNFLEGPLIITQYYVDVLKSLGLFNKADLNIVGTHTPSYLRTKALRDLHSNNPEATVSILEYLQERYDLEDKYTMYLLVAGLLESGRYNDASLQISLIKALLNDDSADFLTGVQLIQELKITSAKRFLDVPYTDSLIDFKLINFDKYLESL